MGLHVPTVHVRREQFHLAWDNSILPIATVRSGDVVTFDALDASCGQLSADSTADDIATLDFTRVDQVNGPIAIEGADIGDTLEIEMLDLQPSDWGWTASIPGFGLLAEDFPGPVMKTWKLEGDVAEFAPGIEIPLNPFCGEIGVAPRDPGALSTIPPGVHGGNMDTKHITRGARLYLPVLAPGALFSLGDGHAAQGDGEVCGTAIETPMRVQVRLTIRKALAIETPQFLTAGPLGPRTNIEPFYATQGIGPDLYGAAQDAVRRAIEYLGREHGLSPEMAYLLCSVAVDLRISEIVDTPNWIVTAYTPLSIFR